MCVCVCVCVCATRFGQIRNFPVMQNSLKNKQVLPWMGQHMMQSFVFMYFAVLTELGCSTRKENSVLCRVLSFFVDPRQIPAQKRPSNELLMPNYYSSTIRSTLKQKRFGWFGANRAHFGSRILLRHGIVSCIKTLYITPF